MKAISNAGLSFRDLCCRTTLEPPPGEGIFPGVIEFFSHIDAWVVYHGFRRCTMLTTTTSKSTVFTHLEPKEDPMSYDDQGLEHLAPVAQPSASVR